VSNTRSNDESVRVEMLLLAIFLRPLSLPVLGHCGAWIPDRIFFVIFLSFFSLYLSTDTFANRCSPAARLMQADRKRWAVV
jgi:hypothetical protein